MEQLAGKPGKLAWPPTRAAKLLHSWKEELGRARRAAPESLLFGQRAGRLCIGGTKWLVSIELHIHRDMLQVQEIVFILDLYF